MEKQLFYSVLVIIGLCLSVLHAQPIVEDTTEKSEDNSYSFKSCNVTLDFSNMGLSIIKENFVSSPFVRSLILKKNSIRVLSENAFKSMPGLTHLDLSNNLIPADQLFSFGSSYSLKSLILDNNSLFGNAFEHCNDEYIRYNQECPSQYSVLNTFYRYPELLHLSIRNIYVNSVSALWKYHVPKLNYLDISYNNFQRTSSDLFESIPSSVTKLIMENIGLTDLKSQKLNNITFLNVNKNNFESLSSHYCDQNTLCLRNFDSLEYFLLSNCSIKRIEVDAFKEVKKLVLLDISNNEFEEIPDGTFEYIPSLSSLDISANSLHMIPDFSTLQNLTTLIMNDMKDKIIFYSFEAFSQMKMLKVLSLRNNEITMISIDLLNNLPKLEELDLSENNIVSLPAWSWQDTLQKLHLNRNKISKIEDLSLEEAKELKLLELEGNSVSSIKLGSLKKLSDDTIIKL